MTYPWTPDRISAYQLIRCLELGAKTLNRIFKNWNKRLPEMILDRKGWKEFGLSEQQRNALAFSLASNIESELHLMEEQGIHLILAYDDDFPSCLAHIPDPPAGLFFRGAPLREGLRIAIVGTRKMTPYGKRCAAYFSETVSDANMTVVSGLAFGIDASAHRGALNLNHPTIAVLPCGIDDRSIMPQSHIMLAKEILEKGGTLVSEHAPATPALPFLYLHRNRIISGLAEAVLVIEADKASGALTTAKLALEQGREVLAVPGPIWSDVSRGTNQLIKDGATPCTCTDDLLSAVGADKPERAMMITETRQQLPMNPVEQKILAHLSEPASADDLVRTLHISPAEMNALLSILEMKGYIELMEGGMYTQTHPKSFPCQGSQTHPKSFPCQGRT
jgi:DNA processing protein